MRIRFSTLNPKPKLTELWLIRGEMFASMSVLLSLPKHGDSMCVSFEFLYTKGFRSSRKHVCELWVRVYTGVF
jgi:hypothetical protein